MDRPRAVSYSLSLIIKFNIEIYQDKLGYTVDHNMISDGVFFKLPLHMERPASDERFPSKTKSAGPLGQQGCETFLMSSLKC